ncbi:GLDC isoform 22, partial [Pan troglodytes]
SLTCVTSSHWDRPYSREVAAFPLTESRSVAQAGVQWHDPGFMPFSYLSLPLGLQAPATMPGPS